MSSFHWVHKKCTLYSTTMKLHFLKSLLWSLQRYLCLKLLLIIDKAFSNSLIPYFVLSLGDVNCYLIKKVNQPERQSSKKKVLLWMCLKGNFYI